MDTYIPLPNDIIRQGAQELTVSRVFPTQVICEIGNKPVEYTRENFDRLAKGSFFKGAVLIRGGEQIYPPITAPAPAPEPVTTVTEETPITITTTMQSGSHNTHARLSPSDSKRWTSCTASIAFQEANSHRIKEGDTTFSNEGTEAHDWATKLLLGQIGPIDIPENFRDPVTTYTDHCQSLIADPVVTSLQSCLDDFALGFDAPNDVVFIEEQIPLFYQEEQTGTADFIGLTAFAGQAIRLFVRDYKHGMGVLVGTDENTQLAIYAYSVVKHLSTAYQFSDDCPVDIAIVQPRHREAGDPTPWVITVADLRTFCEDIEYRAIQARTAAERVRERITTVGENVSNAAILEAAPGSVFAPSEGDEGACRWCKCKAFCSVRLAAATEECELPSMSAEDMLAQMPTLDKAPVETRLSTISEALGSQGLIITDEYLVNLVGRAKAIRSFLSDAEEFLEGRLLAGEQIDGVKLVDGREGNRDWSNETEAETFLKGQGMKMEERFDFKLKSPAKIEALLKDKLKSSVRTKNRFEQLITRSSGKKKLAIDSDKRDAVVPAVAMMPVVEDTVEVDDFEV